MIIFLNFCLKFILDKNKYKMINTGHKNSIVLDWNKRITKEQKTIIVFFIIDNFLFSNSYIRKKIITIKEVLDKPVGLGAEKSWEYTPGHIL